MEMISIPLQTLKESLRYFENAANDYAGSGSENMQYWAEGNVSAIRRIIETFSNTRTIETEDGYVFETDSD